MSAVGLDIGSDGIIVAVVRNRGIEVLQNEVGKRITPNIVAFSGKQRFMGDQAVAQFMSNPKNSIKYARRLLGVKYDDPELKHERTFLTYKIDKTKDGGIGIDVNYDDSKQVFTPEQIVATSLNRAKGIAEAGLGTKVQDVVIGVPFYWTDRQRRALLDAAAIAGLNVLRLMHETTAVALSYGILRPLPEKETRYVLFVDLGLASYQVSLVSFTAGKELKVIATEYDRNFGARNIDQLLANHFAKFIKTKYNLDVLSEPKATLKLYKECDKVKTVLSANSSAEFHVEYIMNDKDVSGNMERTEYEALVVSNFFERLIAPLKRVFDSAGAKELKITKDNIHSVEIVGGGVRVPVIQKTLKEFLGKELGKTCDSDESVARGCALQCAMLSPSFKVKEFAVNDIYPSPIDVSWGAVPTKDAMDVEPSKPTTLFPKFQPIPSVKSLTFPDRLEPFQIVARYSDPSPVADPFIGRWVVGGIPPPQPGKPAPKVKVFIKLNLSGVFSVSSAHHIEEYWVEEPAEPEPKKEDPKATASTDPKDKDKESPKPDAEKPKESGEEEPKPKAKKEAKKGKKKSKTGAGDEEKPKKKGKGKTGEKKGKKKSKDESKPMDEEPTGTEKPSSEKPKEDAKENGASETPASPVMKKKKKTRRVDLKVEPLVTASLSEREVKDYTEKEVRMANQDRVVEETGEARNALESYVLDTRSKLQDEYELGQFVKEQEAKAILDYLKEQEDWLEGDGFDAQKSDYAARLDEAKKKGDPVYRRKKEAEGREELVSKLKSAIGKYSNFATSTDEKYAHIEEAEKKKVLKLATEIDQWLAQSLSKQDKIPKTDDPFLTIKLLKDKTETLEKEGEPILTKPKPKPKEEPKKEDAKKDGKKEEPKKEEPKDDGKDKEKEQVTKKAKTGSDKESDSSAKMDTS